VVEKAYGLEIPQSLEEACDPTRTALLVYDMQVGIIGQLKNGTEIVTRVRTVLDAARAAVAMLTDIEAILRVLSRMSPA
jgi:biuret amidohydrolase